MTTIRNRHLGAVAAAVLMLAAVLLRAEVPAMAQEGGNAFAGQELSQRWCANCHAIGTAPQPQAADSAPSFAAIAAMKSTTAASLTAFLATPHARMPDYALSRDDVGNVAAYILSLRKH